ncbi:MAG TPA: holo-ACP synthase [Thermoanaerobaculia bacterium]|nr:holo-ACP synthase [Thermoanaerobaculia bacterium]HUM30352.1 holo-ACP synthase [Thermoanaerobaculia bacterium]HXK68497.1 holo-ACP synthase [Thermoanaerobaculia bacterium]
MIYGIGVDIVNLKRIASAYSRFGKKFLHRITHPGEIRHADEHPVFIQELAVIFSMKEAVYKALRPVGFPIRFTDVEVIHLPGGAPSVRLHGRLAVHASQANVGEIHVSMTHERDQAVTVAIAMKNGSAAPWEPKKED